MSKEQSRTADADRKSYYSLRVKSTTRVRRSGETKNKAKKNGGGGRDRTDDLKLAKLPLSQLSYAPGIFRKPLLLRCVAAIRALKMPLVTTKTHHVKHGGPG